MNKVRAVDIIFLDELFEMGGGYVLTFTDATFRQFFSEELRVDIDNPIYAQSGTSKAKRLRTFLQISDAAIIVRALNALWEYREALRKRTGKPDKLIEARAQLDALLNRLKGTPEAETETKPSNQNIDQQKLASLRSRLIELSSLEPQPRGYAFEVFLKDLFNIYGLAAREPFRLSGEQIDGSFQLSSETYLLEAKWQGLKTGSPNCTHFTEKLSRRLLGPADFSLATADLLRRGL